MKVGIKVGDLMTRKIIAVNPETNLRKCASTMLKNRIGSLLVLDGGKLMGMITEKDIIWALMKKSKKDLSDIKAGDLMRRKLVTIRPSADLTEALNKLKRNKVKRLPVVERGNVIGVITINDILKIEPGLYQLFVENVKIKEEAKKLKLRKNVKVFSGICEDCGNFDLLSQESGQALCSQCNDER